MASPETPTAGGGAPTAGNHAAIESNAADTVADDPLKGAWAEPSPQVFKLKITRLSDIDRRWPTFLYPERVPESALTILAGDPGLGKSTWTAYLAAKVTRGELGPAGTVMFALGEDGMGSVFHGRMEAAGADLQKVHVFQGRDADPFCLPDRVPDLAKDAMQLGARLVVIDPLDNFWTPNIRTKDASSLRTALTPLAAMAEELRVAIIVVAHLNKGRGQPANHRISGNLGGLVGTVRSTLLFTLDPNDPDDEHGRRAMGHTKSNWGKTARTEIYQHQGVELPDADGRVFSVSRLKHLGESEIPGEALVADASDETPEDKTEQAIEILADELQDGEWHRKGGLVEAAKRRGIGKRTLERAAQNEGVEHKREGFPAVGYWRLPSSAKHEGATDMAGLDGPHGKAEPVGLVPQSRQGPMNGVTDPHDQSAENDVTEGEPPPDQPYPSGSDGPDPIGQAEKSDEIKAMVESVFGPVEEIQDQAAAEVIT